MATQLLRTIDRWRFEAPMAVLLAGAAGFAVMAMPRDLFAQLPVAGDLGRLGQGAVAAAAALVCAIAGYLAMRRPATRRPMIEEDEDFDLFPPAEAASAPVPAEIPVRLRRADRHPDAPAREPIRASRDLGEPFMDVAPLVPAQEEEAPDHVEREVLEADAVEADALTNLAEQDAVETDRSFEEPADQHDGPLSIAPGAMPAEAEAEPELVLDASPVPLPLPRMPAPVVEMPVRPARRPFAGIGRREDTSLSAMIDRLSEGMKLRGEGLVGSMEPPRDRSLALRDALDELNRLAARRG